MRKLDSRGHSCLFMGYDLEHPDYYIVYDRVLRSFIRSPHVVFDETNFLHGARQGGRGSVEYSSDEIDILEGIVAFGDEPTESDEEFECKSSSDQEGMIIFLVSPL